MKMCVNWTSKRLYLAYFNLTTELDFVLSKKFNQFEHNILKMYELKFLLKHTIKEFFTTEGGTGEEEGAMNMIKLNVLAF